MSKTFIRFNSHEQNKLFNNKNTNEVNDTSHDLSGDFPLDDAESESILEKLRADKENEQEIERLNKAVDALESKLAQRDGAIANALGEIKSIRDRLVNEIPERLLKTADSIIREAIKDNIPSIIMQRIDEVIGRDDKALFFASEKTASKFDCKLIAIDESLPENILVYQDSDGKKHVIELEESI